MESSLNNPRDNHGRGAWWWKKLHNKIIWWLQVWTLHLLWSLQGQEQRLHVPRRLWRGFKLGVKSNEKEEEYLQDLRKVWSGWPMQQGRILCLPWHIWREQPRVSSLQNIWRQLDFAKKLNSWKQGTGMKQWIYLIDINEGLTWKKWEVSNSTKALSFLAA